jgi:leader peptidase (prepilin peptidase) / N-methyltransferase
MSRVDDRGAATGASGWRWLVTVATLTPLLRWLVLVHSVPAEASWRHACPHCQVPITPACGLGALRPGGRCCGCGRRIGAPGYLLEMVTVLAGGLVVLAAIGRTPAEVVALALWAALGVALVFIDLAVHRLPDRLTLPAAGGTLALLGLAALTGGEGSWPRALAAAAACGGGFLVVTLVLGTRAFGLGDAKLAFSVGALLGWFGWPAVVGGLALAFIGNGLVAVALLITRRVGWRDQMPFGPYLIGGPLLALALLNWPPGAVTI